MLKIGFLAGLLIIAVTLMAPRTVMACPACTAGVEEAAESGGDTDNFGPAVNQSIYLMVSVPYAALMVFGFLVYRGMKKNTAYLEALQSARQPAHA